MGTIEKKKLLLHWKLKNYIHFETISYFKSEGVFAKFLKKHDKNKENVKECP